MTTYVGPEGPLTASIMIIGEAPGATEEQLGRPFVGSSGKLLDGMLMSVGINRRDCWVTNVVKRRPPGNNFGIYYNDSKRKEPTELLNEAWTKLAAEIEQVSPKVIIVLGNEALRAVTGRRGIEKWRGSVLEGNSGCSWVVPTFHPAYVLRVYSSRAVVELDLKKALRVSEKGFQKPEHTFQIEPSFKDVMETLERLLTVEKVAFDIETLGQHVRCLGLAWSSEEALCIPFISNANSIRPGDTTLLVGGGTESFRSHWSLEEERAIVNSLKKVFLHKGLKKIAQNYPFDATILWKDFGIETKGLWMDTMVAQHCVYSELPKSLDFLCSVYTDVPRYSDYSPSVDKQTWIYNCFDCAVTFEVSTALEKELRERGQWDFYKGFAEPAMVALARAGSRGVLINLQLRTKMRTNLEERLEKIKSLLEGKTGTQVNPNSPKQMLSFLYETLALPKIMNFKTKKPTANEDAIDRLRAKFPQHREVFELLVEYRKTVKLIAFCNSTCLPNGRLSTSYNATGTKTGRISSSKTIFDEGANHQQMPRGPFRRIVTAPAGSVLIKMDLSQAESRATAWYARIRSLIDRFTNDPTFDVHIWNASIIYGVPEAQVTKALRDKGKAAGHGGNYGITARGSSKITGVPVHEAQAALDNYKGALPELVRWWQEVRETVGSTRMLRTVMGRLRIFLDRLDDHTFRSAYAQLPQSTVGDIINRAFTILEDTLPEGNSPVLQVHDEIDVEARIEDVWTVIDLMQEAAEISLVFHGVPEPLVIPADFGIGPNWHDLVSLDVWRARTEKCCQTCREKGFIPQLRDGVTTNITCPECKGRSVKSE